MVSAAVISASRAAAITALTTGLVTEVAVEDDPFGFCHWSGKPGGLVAVDSFYIGNLKGVGKVYQLTAVDTATRWAMVWLVHGTVNKTVSVAFFERIGKTWRKMGSRSRRSLPTTGPNTKQPSSLTRSPRRTSPACSSRRGHRTTMLWSNGFKEPCSKSAGGPRSTGSASTACDSCNAKPMPGATPTTTTAATTATT